VDGRELLRDLGERQEREFQVVDLGKSVDRRELLLGDFGKVISTELTIHGWVRGCTKNGAGLGQD